MWVLIMSESMQEMMEREKAEAVAMMKRANSAMSRIFGIDDSSVGTCDKCNSWDDSLETGVCQTCIKEDEGDE
jgi:hypothetical protein